MKPSTVAKLKLILIGTSRKKYPLITPVLLLLFAGLFFINLSVGSSGISLSDISMAISDKTSAAYTILVYLRLPRVLACVLVGAALAVAGMILQTMLNNSLASPGIIGINSGAGLSVVLFALFTQSLIWQTVGTFIGAFLSAMLIFFIGKSSGASRNRLVLAGIAISRLLAALIDIIILLEPSLLIDKTTFQLGTLAKANYETVIFAAPFIVVGLILAVCFSRNLSLLCYGDDVATSMGLNVKRFRFICLFIVALLSAGAVSIAGLLSFLGLIAPHIVRKLIGVFDYFRLTIVTMVFGADLTLLCDLLARTMFVPYELPVGVIMALLGVPFFLAILLGKEKGGKLA